MDTSLPPERLIEKLADIIVFQPRGEDAAEATPAGFKRITSRTILETKFEPLRWAVPGYVPEGLSVLAGQQKLGKTWLALDFAFAVAMGGVAMGKVPVDEGDVLYLDLENGPRRIQDRIKALIPRASGAALGRLEWVNESPPIGRDFFSALDDWRASVRRPRLVVVDVLARIKPIPRMNGGTAYDNDYPIFAPLQQWATDNRIAVLLITHTKKGGAEDPLEAVTGSNGLSACADATLVLDRKAEGVTLYVRGRDVEETDTALTFVQGQWQAKGEAFAVRRSAERTQILDVLFSADEPMTPAEIASATGLKRNNVDQFLHQLGNAGEVTKVGRGKYVHPERSDLAPPPKKARKLRREDEGED